MVTGFLIKTYYHRYRVFRPTQMEEKVVRVSQNFFEEYQKHVGMSVFRRYEQNQVEEDYPLPPGSPLYIGDLSYGRWKFLNSARKPGNFIMLIKIIQNISAGVILDQLLNFYKN